MPRSIPDLIVDAPQSEPTDVRALAQDYVAALPAPVLPDWGCIPEGWELVPPGTPCTVRVSKIVLLHGGRRPYEIRHGAILSYAAEVRLLGASRLARTQDAAMISGHRHSWIETDQGVLYQP